MKRLSSALAIGAALACATTSFAGSVVKYRHYFNEKYGYSVEYPSFLSSPGEPDAHDGESFASPTNPLTIAVWGAFSNWMNGDEMTLGQQRDWTAKNLAGADLPAVKVTYQAAGKNWFVLSGTSGNNAFYERTVKGPTAFATVRLTYPVAQKSQFDPVVSRVARSLQNR